MDSTWDVNLALDAFPRYQKDGAGVVGWRELARDPQLKTPELGADFTVPWWYASRAVTVQQGTEQGVCVKPAADVRPDDLRERSLPLWFRADTGPGCFRVTATLYAKQNCPDALLFVSRRRLAWRGALCAGQSVTVRCLCDVSPIYPAGKSGLTDSSPGLCQMNSVDLSVVGAGVCLQRVSIRRARVPRLCLAGDSTVTDQSSPVFYCPGACYSGWGQMLPIYVGEQYCVSNHAHSGLSTQTFRSEGHYDNLRALLRPGDVVLIQFGHNDQKWKHLAADTGYWQNLSRYIDELRALQARPVLVTPLARNTWKDEESYNDLLFQHAGAVTRLGQEKGVPVVDLHAWMIDTITKAGMQAARQWFHPFDYTHLNDFGSYLVAGFVAAQLRKLGFLATDTPIPPPWPVSGPMSELEPPPDWRARGLVRPENDKPLVDYGLVTDFPWPVQ